MGATGSAQSEFGIDLTLIDERLALTPTERWERHAQALAFVEEIRAARAQRPLSDSPTASR